MAKFYIKNTSGEYYAGLDLHVAGFLVFVDDKKDAFSAETFQDADWQRMGIHYNGIDVSGLRINEED